MQYLTIVLGAGASKPYGFPLGDALVDQMVARTLDHARHIESNVKKLYRDSLPDNAVRHIEALKLSAETLELYAPLSIDRYLDSYYRNDPEALKDHKDIIALEILHCFCQAHIKKNFGKKNEGNWLRFIIPELFDIFDSYKARNKHLACPIKFITFNYDLSLEFYIERIVYNARKYSLEEREDFLKWIGASIVHVYGQIGAYTWSGCANQEAVQSWHTFTHELLNHRYTAEGLIAAESDEKRALWRLAQKFSKNIELISSIRTEKCQSSSTIENWLTNTRTLLFSGYAFHPENNKILGLTNWDNKPTHLAKNMHGIILGLYKASRREDAAARELFVEYVEANQSMKRAVFDGKNHPNLDRQSPWMIGYNLTTYDLLRDEVILSHLYSR
jgi:hypothetical protein